MIYKFDMPRFFFFITFNCLSELCLSLRKDLFKYRFSSSVDNHFATKQRHCLLTREHFWGSNFFNDLIVMDYSGRHRRSIWSDGKGKLRYFDFGDLYFFCEVGSNWPGIYSVQWTFIEWKHEWRVRGNIGISCAREYEREVNKDM